MRILAASCAAVCLVLLPADGHAANENAQAQLSWSATSLVTDVATPASSVTLSVQLTSGVTSFKGGECEIRWRPLGDSSSCLVRTSTLFRTSAGTVCTYLNRGTPVSIEVTDVPGTHRVQWTSAQSLNTCAAGTIAQFIFDLSGCAAPAASFSLCALSLNDANGGVTELPALQLGVPVTLAGGGSFTASCANPPVVDVRDTTIAAGDTLRLTPWVSNPDGFPLTWSATGLPAGASIDAISGLLTWATSVGQAGLVAGLRVTASDSRQASGSDTVTVVVATGLTLAALADTTVDELHQAVAQPAVVGSHGTLTWDGIGLPSGATVDPLSGRFTWTPDRYAGDIYWKGNVYTITLRARESVAVSGQTSFMLTVHDTNTPPVITETVHDTTMCAGDAAYLSITASDAEGTVLSGGGVGMPDWVSVSATIKGLRVVAEPGYADAGVYSGRIWVADDEGLADTSATVWTLTVLDDPLAPVLTPIPDQVVAEGDTLVIVPQVDNPRPQDPLGWGMTIGGNYLSNIASQDAVTGAITFVAPSSCATSQTSYDLTLYVKNVHCGTGIEPFLVQVVPKSVVICTTTAQFCTTRLISVALTAAGGDASPLVWTSPDLPSWANLTGGGMLSGYAPTGTSGRDTFTVVATNPNSGSTGSASFIATFSECTAAASLTVEPASAVHLDAAAPPLYVLRFTALGELRQEGVTPARVVLARRATRITPARIAWDGAVATVSFAREEMARLLAGAPRAGEVAVTLEVSDDRNASLSAAFSLALAGAEIAAAYPVPSHGDVWLRLPAAPRAGEDVAVFSAAGARVRLLVRATGATPVPLLLRWDGRFDDGSRAPAGVYYARAGVAGGMRVVLVR